MSAGARATRLVLTDRDGVLNEDRPEGVRSPEELQAFVQEHPEVFPAGKSFDSIAFAAPEQVPEIAELLVARGFSDEETRAVLGENWLRVARAVWK